MSRERILIVDDEEYIRTMLQMVLQKLDYECTSASNGQECLDIISRGNDYDIVLLDINMPKMDGLETLKELKKLSHHDLSVVIISASKDAENVKEALKEGAYDYVFKPFNIHEVQAVIRRAVERANLLRENRDYQHNLEKRVAEQTNELFNLYSDMLQSMILALDLREKETGFHSYRVTEYTLTLANRLELNHTALTDIAKGALLHDIGKIGVPDSILLKPDKLNDDEWELMRKHPVFGHDLVKRIKFLGDSSDLILYHHERFDGGGYPFGLRGADIPLGARIFSVTDTLDALTSDRFYRAAVTFDEARDTIARASGSQFDPAIVGKFLEIPTREWTAIRDSIETSGPNYLKNLLSKMT